jgi:hypothetical protein
VKGGWPEHHLVVGEGVAVAILRARSLRCTGVWPAESCSSMYAKASIARSGALMSCTIAYETPSSSPTISCTFASAALRSVRSVTTAENPSIPAAFVDETEIQTGQNRPGATRNWNSLLTPECWACLSNSCNLVPSSSGTNLKTGQLMI